MCFLGVFYETASQLNVQAISFSSDHFTTWIDCNNCVNVFCIDTCVASHSVFVRK